MDISPKTHLLVVSTDDNPVVEDNRILLQTIKGNHDLHKTCFYHKLEIIIGTLELFVQFSDESYVYVPLTPQIQEMFGLVTTAAEAQETHDYEANYESIESPIIAGCSDNQNEVLGKCCR